jgi:hypothetical protein
VVGVAEPRIHEATRQGAVAHQLGHLGSERSLAGGGQRAAGEARLERGRERLAVGVVDQQCDQVLGDEAGGTTDRRGRVVQFVRDARGELPEGGHPGGLDQLQPCPFQLVQCRGQGGAFAIELAVELGLLDLQLLRPAQPSGQRPGGRRGHRRPDVRLHVERVVELLEADVDTSTSVVARAVKNAWRCCVSDSRPTTGPVEAWWSRSSPTSVARSRATEPARTTTTPSTPTP